MSIVHSAIGPQFGWEKAVFKAGAAVENFVHNVGAHKSRVSKELKNRLLHSDL